MKKVLKFQGNRIYVEGTMASIVPSGVEPIEEVDVTTMKEDEIEKVRTDKKLFDKLKKKV